MEPLYQTSVEENPEYSGVTRHRNCTPANKPASLLRLLIAIQVFLFELKEAFVSEVKVMSKTNFYLQCSG